MTTDNSYSEASRYIDNAADILKTKAKKEGRYYNDAKYVRMACGTAYSAVLIAVDEFLKRKGMPIIKKKGRKHVEDYQNRLTNIDKKMLNEFNNAYGILHIEGYYEGITIYNTIKSGFESAAILINKIKPHGISGIKV